MDALSLSEGADNEMDARIYERLCEVAANTGALVRAFEKHTDTVEEIRRKQDDIAKMCTEVISKADNIQDKESLSAGQKGSIALLAALVLWGFGKAIDIAVSMFGEHVFWK